LPKIAQRKMAEAVWARSLWLDCHSHRFRT
jgi:hypothetical protein